jgi:hypothetical protein
VNKPEPSFSVSTNPSTQGPQLFLKLAGVDPSLLRDCPVPDRLFATRVGTHLVFTVSFIFFCVLFSFSASLASDFYSQVFVVLISISIATVVLIVDIYIIHASWEEDGQLALETVSRDQRFQFRPRRSRLKKLAPRIILSVIVASAIATFIDLYIYQKEINRQLIENAKSATDLIKVDIARAIEQDFSIRQQQITEINNQISSLSSQGNMVPSIVGTIASLNSTRDRLREQKRQLDGSLARALQVVDRAENRDLRQAAQRRVRALRAQADRLQAELDANQKSLDEIRRVTPSAERLATERQTLTEKRDTLAKELNDARAKVEQEVQKRLKERGGAIAPAEGFSARFTAMLQYLQGSWSALGLSVLMTALMMFVESSAVVAKIFFSPKTIYAILVATNYNATLRREAFKPDASDEDEVAKMRLRAEIEHLKAEINHLQNERL